MHGLDASNVSSRVVSCRDVTSQVEFGLYAVSYPVTESIECVCADAKVSDERQNKDGGNESELVGMRTYFFRCIFSCMLLMSCFCQHPVGDVELKR